MPLLVQANGAYAKARVMLDQAMGTTLERNHITLDDALKGRVVCNRGGNGHSLLNTSANTALGRVTASVWHAGCNCVDQFEVRAGTARVRIGPRIARNSTYPAESGPSRGSMPASSPAITIENSSTPFRRAGGHGERRSPEQDVYQWSGPRS